MNCCQDCFGDENLPDLEREQIKERRNNCLRAVYLIFLFLYGLAEFVLAIIANQNFSKLPYEYNELMKNWQSDPILDITQQLPNGSCPLNYEQVFLLPNPSGKSLTYWWDGTESYGLCYSRQIGYNFAHIHPTQPKCDYNNQQVCGGTEIEMKSCAPLQSKCPINNLIFVNATQLQGIQIEKYKIQIKINPNLWLLGTSLDNQMPISEFRVSTSNFSCSQTSNNFQQVFFNAPCQENDNRYESLTTVNIKDYQKVNNFTSDQIPSNNVSLYSRSYIKWTLQCRQKNLVDRALVSEDNFNTLERLQLILIIVNLIFFGITGCLYGFLTVFRLTWNLEDVADKVIGESIWYFKIISQIAHMILVLMVFAYSIDQRIFFDQVVFFNCSDDYTMSIFSNIRDNLIQKFFPYDLAIFILFIVHIFIEILACYLFVHQAIRRKKKKSKPSAYELNAHNTSVSYILKPAFTQNNYKQNPYQKGVPYTSQKGQTTQENIIKNQTPANLNGLVQNQNEYFYTQQQENQYKSIPIQVEASSQYNQNQQNFLPSTNTLQRNSSQRVQNAQITSLPVSLQQEFLQSPPQNYGSQNGVRNLLQFESFSGSSSNKNEQIQNSNVALSNFSVNKSKPQEVIQEEQDENKEENRDYEFGIMQSIKMQSTQGRKRPELPTYQPRFYQS